MSVCACLCACVYTCACVFACACAYVCMTSLRQQIAFFNFQYKNVQFECKLLDENNFYLEHVNYMYNNCKTNN